MKRKLLGAIGSLLAGSQLWAQVPSPAPVDPAPVAGNAFSADGSAAPCNRIWGGAEYLLWWVPSAHVPLVTTGNVAQANAAGFNVGTIGAPGTISLNSGTQEYGPLSGSRLTLGSWLGEDSGVGFEVSGFLMGSRTSSFRAVSDATGNPAIAIPAISVPPITTTVQENAQVFASPGTQQGAINFASTINIWGTEANGVFALGDGGGPVRAKMLTGFRYLDVSERLEMYDSTNFNPIAPGGATFLFNDSFETRNQIYAGQIGAQVEATYGRFFVNVIGKTAFGIDHETVNIRGVPAILVPPGVPLLPPLQPVNSGGFFAQKTNIGRQTTDEFVFVPELRIQAGMNFGPNVRAFVGYEILYLSDTARPGAQIDRVINGSQGFGGTLVGEPRPLAPFNHSDMFIQGVSAGLEIRF